MKVFVTGVAGFLGSHIAEWFLKNGHQVAGNDNMIGGDLGNIPDGVKFQWCDITNLAEMTEAMHGADVVYHCAAMAYEGVSVFAPATITNNIMTGSATVFSAAIRNGVKRIVNCSSMARYGAAHAPFREDGETLAQDPYGIAKLSAERLLFNLADSHDFEAVIAVPHNIYGPRQHYCMAGDALVKLTNGFKPIAKVRAGDEVLIGGTKAAVVDQFSLGTKPALTLALASGQSVTVGRDHRFQILEKDHLVWKPASDLKVGDSVVSEASIGCVIDKDNQDYRYGQFLGLMIADGSYNDPYEVNLACCIDEDKPDLRDLLTELDIKFRENERGVFRFGSKAFVDHLRTLGFHATAADKIIPDAVLAMSHETVTGVLSGLFSGDGWVVKDQNIVGFASISERLVRQVQRLLLSYGLRASITRRDPKPDRMIEGRAINSGPIWHLIMLSENASRFAEIGFVYKRKQELVEAKAGLKPSGTIPGLGSYLSDVGPLLPMAVRAQKPNALNCPRDGVSRFSLNQIVQYIDEWLSSDEAKISDGYTAFIQQHRERWARLANGGHHVQIEAIIGTEVELFDISVDADHHSYVGDGLISHNCDPYRNVASIMANMMLRKKRPVIYGDGTQIRCFSYISDCLSCLVQMADKPEVVGQVINIGPDEGAITINELYAKLATITGFKEPPVYMPGRPQEVFHATCSSDKARRLLGYQTTVLPDEGLKHLVDWISKKGPKPFFYDHLEMEFTTSRTPRTWTDRLF